MNEFFFWSFLTFVCLLFQAFFCMSEMAAVSFNRIRLQYFMSKGNLRAKWLYFLLEKPSRLFSTTLFCVNMALQFGSECSRQAYLSLNISPQWAPLTQVFIVVIFAELAPMIAARRFAEHVIMITIPIVYATAKILTPLVLVIDFIYRFIQSFFPSQNTASTAHYFLNRNDLQKSLEREEAHKFVSKDTQEFNLIVSNLFTLKSKTAKEVMASLATIQMLPSNSTIHHIKNILKQTQNPFVPIYHRTKSHIIGIAYPRDLIKCAENKQVREFLKAPWFITKETLVIDLLHQFRKNKQSVAVILNSSGQALGILTLKDILDEIFGEKENDSSSSSHIHYTVIDKSFSGQTPLSDLKEQYGLNFENTDVHTLSQLILFILGRPAEKGDKLEIGAYDLLVEEVSLLNVKSVNIKTRNS